MLEKDGPCYPRIDQVMPAVAEALGITVKQVGTADRREKSSGWGPVRRGAPI